MKVVVDTSVWSLVLRRSKVVASPFRDLLVELIHDRRAILLGIVRQEILSGIKYSEQFEKLKTQLRSFPDLPIETEDYEVGAKFYNLCSASGVQGSHTDFLICGWAVRRNYEVLALDPDFSHYSRHIPLMLMHP